MKNLSQAAELIKALRVAKGKTQAQLAAILDVTQPMISAWEGGSDEPSCEMFTKLGNLASYPDNLWFWEQAGLDREKILHTADQILKERTKERSTLPDPNAVVEIQRFRLTAQGREEVDPPLLIAADRVPNPLSTVCLVLDEKTAGPVFSAGDTIAVDRSGEGAQDLRPFWGKVVLVEFAPHGQRAGGLDDIWPVGLIVGRLLLKIWDEARRLSWSAQLGSLSDAIRAESIPVGFWTYKYPPDLKLDAWGQPDDLRDWDRAIKEAENLGPEKVQLALGCRIIGRIIAWFPAPSEKK